MVPPCCFNTTPYGVMAWHGSENSCFLPGYFEAAQFASQHIDLVQSMVMLAGWGQAAPFTGITLQPFMLGATVNPWTCPLLPENTNHLRVRISALQQKSTQEKPHCNNVNVLKSLLGGNNAYLMVTTICIYINWNECFSHNCSLC